MDALPLVPDSFRRTKPIASGETASDREFGMLGIVQGVNHAMAHKVKTICQDSTRDTTRDSIFLDINGTTKSITQRCMVEFGDKVFQVRLKARIRNGSIGLRVNDGTSTLNATSAIIGTSFTTVIVTITLGVTTGALGWIVLRVNNGGDTPNFMEIQRYCVSELVLTTVA